MKLMFLFVGGGPKWQELAVAVFEKKISAFVKTEIRCLKPAQHGRSDAAVKKTEESKAILAELKPTDAVILCDEAGETVNTRLAMKKFTRYIESGKSRLVLVVGGAYGASDDLKNRADWKLSLSALTFNHQLAQLVLLEQVYRFLTLWRGIPYHND